MSATNVTFDRNSATGGDGRRFGGRTRSTTRSARVAGVAGALWVQGRGRNGGDPVAVELTGVDFLRNTATGAAGGSQGWRAWPPHEGGRVVGGAFGTVEWSALAATDVTFADNTAHGGGAGPNAPWAGPNTGTGGVHPGQSLRESPASMNRRRDCPSATNTSQGGTGNDLPLRVREPRPARGQLRLRRRDADVQRDRYGHRSRCGRIPLASGTSFVGNRAIGGQTGEGRNRNSAAADSRRRRIDDDRAVPKASRRRPIHRQLGDRGTGQNPLRRWPQSLRSPNRGPGKVAAVDTEQRVPQQHRGRGRRCFRHRLPADRRWRFLQQRRWNRHLRHPVRR